MALEINSQNVRREPEPTKDFASRLEEALAKADRTRTRDVWIGRAKVAAWLLILTVPIIFWRLGGATHDGLGASINAFAWIAFLLDAGVHVDSSILSYLGLKALPIVVGVLILCLVTATLLTGPGEPR